MADIEPLKLKIWNSARADNWEQFNEDCETLIEKAVGDWWRIGWSLAPNSIDEIYHILDGAAKNAHEAWLKAMENGDAPAEDISPGEGFLLVKKIIQDAVNGKEVKNDSSRDD
jgi:hypothetical protein